MICNDKHSDFITCSGSPIYECLELFVDSHGVKDLRKTGEVKNTYLMIQSHADSCDIHTILDRYSNGDVSVLGTVSGGFTDVTNMPSTFAEAQQLLLDATNKFDSLPVDVRAKFNHSPSEFIASFGTPKFNDVFFPQSVEKPVESEVVLDESSEK